jgi:Zn-dependent protease
MFDRLLHPEFILYSLPGILIGLVFHELSHAFVADRLGDPTPRNMGRLTLNPLPHLDPIGTVMIILLGFGWAKPVMTNPAMYKKCKKHGFALVGVAGVIMNFFLGFFFLFLLLILLNNKIIPIDGVIFQILFSAAGINFILMVFNLIPIPPLDGYNILKNLVLIKFVRAQTLWSIERYGQYVLLALVFLGGTSLFIGNARDFFLSMGINLFNWIFHAPFVLG